MQAPNPCLDYLIDPSFYGVNRRFLLSFESTADRTVHTKYYLPTVEIKDYNVMIDGQNFFDQPAKNNLRTYDNIKKVATGQDDDYTTSCLFDYNCLNKFYKTIAIELCKQQASDADQKQYNKLILLLNLNRGRNVNDNTTMLFIIEETKETISDFSQGTVRVL